MARRQDVDMSITVRQATVADADAVGLIHVRSWQAAYRGLMPDEFLDSLDVDSRVEEWRRIFNGEVPVGSLPFPHDVVVEVEGEVVGFANIGAFRQPDPDSPLPRSTAENPGELWAMYALPDHWGSGVGHALMTATMDELRSKAHDMAYLWVLTGNERARRFYERNGWICDEVSTDLDIRGVTVNEVRYSIQLDC